MTYGPIGVVAAATLLTALSEALKDSTAPHSLQTKNSRPITPNWCAPQVPMCRSWFYKASNTPLRKADHLSLAIGPMMVCV